jgi:hypothetical protein
MTRRDERRAECADKIIGALAGIGIDITEREAFAIIDSLHGIARLVPLKTPKGMGACDAVNEVYDLTNPPR